MLMAAIPQGTEKNGIFKVFLEVVASRETAPDYLKSRAQEIVIQARAVARSGVTPQGLSKDVLSLAVIIRSNQDVAAKLDSINCFDDLTQLDAKQMLRQMEPNFARLF